MKKSFFSKVLLPLSIVAMMTTVGCKDYDDDIDSINERLDALENQKLASVSDQIAAMQASITSLEGAKASLTTLITNMTTQLGSLQTALTTAQNTAAAAKTDAAKALADIVTLQGAVTTIQGQIKALQTEDTALEGKIKAIQDVIPTLATKTWAEATFATLEAQQKTAQTVGEIQTTLATATSNISSLQTSVAGLTGDVASIQSALTTMQSAIAGTDGKVSQAVADVKAWVNTQLAGYYTSGEVDGKLAALKTTVEQYVGSQNAALVAAFKAARKSTLDSLATVDASLAAQIKAGDASLLDSLGKMKTSFTAALAAMNTTLSKAIGDEAAARVTADDAIVAALNQEIADRTAAINTAKDELTTAYTAAIKSAVDAQGEINKAVQDSLAAVNGRVAALASKVDSIEANVKGMRIDVDALLARIQSLVYIPERSDSKAEINYALMEGNPQVYNEGRGYAVEGTSMLTYRVAPADAAEQIVSAFNSGKADLSYYVTSVENITKSGINPYYMGEDQAKMSVVRAYTIDEIIDMFKNQNLDPMFEAVMYQNVKGGDQDAYEAWVKSIKEKYSGVMIFLVQARNFTGGFYNCNPISDSDYQYYKDYYDAWHHGLYTVPARTYAAALKFSNGNDDRTTEYTQLIASEHPIDYLMPDVVVPDGTGDYSSYKTVAYHIPYTDTKTVDTLLQNHRFMYRTNNDSYYTPAELQSFGFDVPVPDSAMVVTHDKDNAVDSSAFKITDVINIDTTNHYTPFASLKKVQKEAVGATATGGVVYYTDKYDWEDDAYALDSVYIDPVKATITMKDVTVNWDYTLDHKFDGKAGATYSRESLVAEINTKDLPADVTVQNALTADKQSMGIAPASSSVTLGGVEYNSATTLKLTNLTFKADDWDDSYTYTAVYSNGYVQTTITGKVTLANRPEVIDVYYTKEPTAWTYSSKMVQKNVKVGTLEAVYDSLKSYRHVNYLGTMTFDEFKKAFFAADSISTVTATVTTKKYPTATSYAGTKMDYVSGTTDSVKVAYDYNDFTHIYADTLQYLTAVTEKFGLKINMHKSIDLNLPSYNFKHVSAWVVYNSAKDCYSNVAPVYTPDKASTAVSAFNVQKVNMNSAFKVVDGTGKVLSNSELAANGLTRSFKIEDTPVHEGITMVADSLVSYMGMADHVGVYGSLTMDEGKVVLPTNFDTVYANYIVKKYDPIGALTVKNDATLTISSSHGTGLETLSVMNQLQLKDFRGYQDDSTLYPVFDLIKDGAWVVGDGTNGFADGVAVTTVYDPLTISFSAPDIPDALKNNVTVTANDTDATITFDHGNQLVLQEDVPLTFKVTVTYTWGIKTCDVTFTIKKQVTGE